MPRRPARCRRPSVLHRRRERARSPWCGGYRRVMYVEVNNARFWVVEAGDGPAVLFLHFGLGDHRVFEPELRALADAFRCVAYDRRFVGRTEAPAEPYSDVEDAAGLLDAL